MINPFESIESRLNKIELLLLDLKSKPSDSIKLEKENQLLNIQEAAKFLNLTVPTIYSKVSKAELPVMKKGNRLYFSQRELSEYLKSGRRKTNDELMLEASNYLSNKKGLNNEK